MTEMNKPIKIYGCMQCKIEFKDDKEAQEHYDEFKAKDDTTHVSTVVKMIGVVTKHNVTKPKFTQV